MLIDELRQKLKDLDSTMEAIKSFWKQSKSAETLEELKTIINNQDFWQHEQRDQLASKHHHLKELSERYERVVESYNDYLEMIELFQDNEEELTNLQEEINQFYRDTLKFKVELLLNKEDDDSNCYLNINAGAGGTESQDWAEMLLRMYLRFCEREHFKVDILDYQNGEEAGIKSATLYIKKKNAFGFLRSEIGIHRLVRISPFDSNKRRHTSFAAVSITPEVENIKITIDENDLRIDTYRASGAGGQHVNKTDSAVRITHMPTGIVVQCQNERSQLRNKNTAMKMLQAKLNERQREEQKAKEASIGKQQIGWGSQIRSYVLHPYKMVKDHRTGFESPQPDQVLDGDLMPFIESYLLHEVGS